MGHMSETYQSKRERWQRMLGNLPAALRQHVSLRNVEAVSALSPKAQARLVEAIQAGLKRLPRAIEQLKENADTPLAELLNPTQIADTQPQLELSKNIKDELADLVQACYPDMPRVSAEALADAEAMQVAGQVAEAFCAMFASNHLKADFVLVVLYALVSQSLDRLETLIADTHAVQQVLTQSDLPNIPTQWRHSNA
jgi:F0F1-type ATP synthase delta subunit